MDALAQLLRGFTRSMQQKRRMMKILILKSTKILIVQACRAMDSGFAKEKYFLRLIAGGVASRLRPKICMLYSSPQWPLALGVMFP